MSLIICCRRLYIVSKVNSCANIRLCSNITSKKLCHSRYVFQNQLTDVDLSQWSCLTLQKRLKYTRKKEVKKNEDDSDDSDSDNEMNETLEKNAKIITSYLSIPRVDAVIKAGLGIARNKAEVIFLENKVRINGYKVPKKSHRVHLGDEVDVIKSPIQENNRLIISRVMFISANQVNDREELKCKLKVFKTLEIDNYKEHPYKSLQTSS